MKVVTCLALCFLGSLILCYSAQADPRAWGENGIPIRQGSHIEWTNSSASDAGGNTLIVWTDMHTGSRDVNAQLMTAAGQAEWAQPVNINQGMRHQSTPRATAVNGGWIVVWDDFREDTIQCGGEDPAPCGHVYGQMLDYAGNRLWSDNNFSGKQITTDHSSLAGVSSDGSGGALIEYYDLTGQPALNVQRVNSVGDQEWPNSPSIPTVYSGIYGAAGTTDGGLILAFTLQGQDWMGDIYALKVSVDGQLVWGMDGTVPVCTAGGNQQMPRVISDGDNGCYVVWEDSRNSPYPDIYAQRLNANGQAFWQTNGVQVCSTAFGQVSPRISLSLSGSPTDGLLASWIDYRGGHDIGEIYAQKMTPDGVPLWQTNGVHVAGDGGSWEGHDRANPQVASDLDGGLVCVWEDSRYSTGYSYSLFAQRLLSTGEAAWEDQGVAVGDSTHRQFSPTIDCFASETSIVFFDGAYSNTESIRFQQLELAGGFRHLGANGTVVMSGFSGSASDLQSIPMNNHRTAFVWSDSRMELAGTRLYYQIVSADSVVERPPNGQMLAPDNEGNPSYIQSNENLCTDGAGGFFVVWVDNRTGVKQIRITHVTPEGEVDGPPAGAIVHVNQRDQIIAQVAWDGTDGCYVAWSEFTPDMWLDLRVMRMTADLTPDWAEPTILTNTSDDDIPTSLLTSDQYSCIVVWDGGSFWDTNVAAARVMINGTIAWSEWVSSAPGRQSYSKAVADGAGGAFVAWEDVRDSTHLEDIYAQHFSADGSINWATNGLPVYSGAGTQDSPQLCADSQHNMYVTWQDGRNGAYYHLYAQKVSPGGVLRWNPNGLPVETSRDASDLAMSQDGRDGFFVTWSEAGVEYDARSLRALHYDSSGVLNPDPFWVPDSGGSLSERPDGYRDAPTMTSDGVGGCVTAWKEYRELYEQGGPLVEIYAQRVYDYANSAREREELLPHEYALYQNYPNPFNPITEIRFDLPQAGSVKLVVYDLLGRQVASLADGYLSAGKHQVPFDASALASGIYFYRLQAGNFEQSRKLVVLK